MNKNKTIILILMLTLSSSLLFAQFSGGSGTEADPYKISSEKDFETLSELADLDSLDDFGVNVTWSYGKYFILTNNIQTKVPCPVSISLAYSFKGNFNGKNYRITLYGDIDPPALFSLISAGAKVSNIIVDGGCCVWGLNEKSAIENCINTTHFFNSKCWSTIVNSVIGYNAIVRNCMNTGSIIYTNEIPGEIVPKAGIIGHIANAYYLFTTIENCINYGCIITNGNPTGGILGLTPTQIANGSIPHIQNCVNVGVINATGPSGGITP